MNSLDGEKQNRSARLQSINNATGSSKPQSKSLRYDLVFRGNKNFRNNCFFNSAINLLSNLSILRMELNWLSESHPLLQLYQAYVRNDSDADFVRLYSFFMNMLQKKKINFKQGAQDDSHMCILFFFDCLSENETCKNSIDKLFGIKTTSIIWCGRCGSEKAERDKNLIQYTIYGTGTEVSTIDKKCELCRSRLQLKLRILQTSYYCMVFFNGTLQHKLRINEILYTCIAIIWKSGSPSGGHYVMSVMFNGNWVFLDGDRKIPPVSNGFKPVVMVYVKTAQNCLS